MKELMTCIRGELEPNSSARVAFRHALYELGEYGTIPSLFSASALELYGVNNEESPCYIANKDIKKQHSLLLELVPLIEE